ncbi:MAG TPA: alpha/beta hydrolase [Bryobacteraceae bacterium]|jgi:pimeloyl-ACP methyl ester carboxylesterase|nr:alpha/beta hydrolase [Bryobacteraceae bacterium]
MSTYVLVHGAWHGSWCWKRVRRGLQERGHEVFTPTLTGVGERSHLLSPEINLETHINDVVNCIRWEELSDVILCGHSYGGCVIRGAADRIAERIAALVYLDAFVPENGESLHSTLPEEMRNGQLDLAKAVGEGWKVPPIPADAFKVNEKDRDWVSRQCTFQAIETFRQPLNLTGAIDRIKNVTFILAGGWSPSPFPRFYEKAKASGWKTLTIDCGHDVMLDEPEQLTQALLSVAASGAPA